MYTGTVVAAAPYHYYLHVIPVLIRLPLPLLFWGSFCNPLPPQGIAPAGVPAFPPPVGVSACPPSAGVRCTHRAIAIHTSHIYTRGILYNIYSTHTHTHPHNIYTVYISIYIYIYIIQYRYYSNAYPHTRPLYRPAPDGRCCIPGT